MDFPLKTPLGFQALGCSCDSLDVRVRVLFLNLILGLSGSFDVGPDP